MVELELTFPAVEIWVTINTTLDDLAVKLSKIYGIPEDAIEACRINNLFSFVFDDLIISSFDWL
jgi:ubiquitin carboxyl-terminal hydrolase 47